MQYMLDANACILLLAGHPTVVGRAEQCEVGALAMSSIAFGEVAIGIARGKPPSLGQLDTLVRRIVTLLPFDEAAARAYSTLPFRRGSFDRLIAAHAVSLDLILITANERDFEDISDLRIENWTI